MKFLLTLVVAVIVAVALSNRLSNDPQQSAETGSTQPPQPAAAIVRPAAPPPFIDTAEARAAAVKRYPQLAVRNSPLNAEFLARFNQYKATNPAYFSVADWPTRLAAESAAEVAQEQLTAAAAQADAVAQANALRENAIEVYGRVLRKIPEGLIVYCPESRPVASYMSSVGGGGSIYSPPPHATGTFLLKGYAQENEVADDDRIKTKGAPVGLFNARNGDTYRVYQEVR